MKLTMRIMLAVFFGLAVVKPACAVDWSKWCFLGPIHKSSKVAKVEKAPEPVKAAVVPVPAAPVDSDGDGVIDSLDKCPNTPKGVSVDANGCPLDSDSDGVYDYLDKCPDTPKGTPVNANGCPQLKADEKVSIQLNVLFDTGKAVVKPDFDTEIKKVADFMNNYPEVKAEIEGHTDNVGAEAMNVSLSQKRADAVSQALSTKFGIAASRLSAKGYGSAKPIADNKTVEGKAKNRRVIATIEAIKK